MYKIFLISIVGLCLGSALAKTLTELKYDLAKLDTDHVDCKSSTDIIDECGLQQGYSLRNPEFGYPTNHTSLLSSCRRQSDALKCLKAYSKCLPPLSKQVLIAMVNSRQKYQKKICTDKPAEASQKLIELNQCIQQNKQSRDKGLQAELMSITIPESITNSKISNVQERIKQSCCSVARVRKDFMDMTVPHCTQYSPIASELIDSYLADTVGIICPDFDSKVKHDCDRLPKLTIPKTSNYKYFVRPIINVIGTLA